MLGLGEGTIQMRNTLKKMRPGARFMAGIVLASGVFAGMVHAQSYDNPTIGQNPVISQPADFKPLGIRAGSFMLHPGVELAAQWNDNVFYTPDGTLDDFIWHVRPYITAQSTWSRHSFSIRAAADIARYSDFDILDYEDYFLQLGGTVDVSSRSMFSYGVDWMRLHEDRSVRSNQQGLAPTLYTQTGGYLGYDHTFNRLSVGLLYDLRSLDYDDSRRADGTVIDNSDRDRDEQDLSLRIGYWLSPDTQLFTTAGWTDTEFDQKYDRNGFDRSGDGWYVGAGVDWLISGVLTGDLYATYRSRSYADPRLPDTDGWGLGGGLTWMPTTLTTVRGSITTDIQDTTQSTASGYLRTLYSVRVDHELLRNLQLNGQVSYSKNDYQLLPDAPPGARAEDTMWLYNVGATYFVNRWMWISASYDYSDFSSNVDFDDFESNIAWLVLGFER
jgi:hypothetical protein